MSNQKHKKMKLTSIVGTGTGKLGGSVFAVSGGQQVVRAYQAQVSNPKSSAQVAQRAKLKLASQFAAAMSPELYTFGRTGMVSPRNKFVRDLFGRDVVTYANGQAEINLSEVRLTPSRVDMFTLSVSKADNTLTVGGYLFTEYVGKVVGARAVVVAKDSSTNEPYIIRTSTLTIDGSGQITGTITLGTSTEVAVYVYAYMPVAKETLVKYQNMEMTAVTAVQLATDVRETPSAFEYSLTRYFSA